MWQRSFHSNMQPGNNFMNGDGCNMFDLQTSSFEMSQQWLSGVPLFAPDAWAPTYDYPLVCYLHDDGRSERDLWRWFPTISDQNYLALGVRAPFPAQSCLPGQYRWRGQRPDATSAALNESIDIVQQSWNVHPDRITLFGEGNGAVVALQQFILNQFDHETSGIRYSGVICRNLPVWWTRALPPVSDFASGRVLLLTSNEHKTDGEIPAAIDGLSESGISVSQADETVQPAPTAINQWLMAGVSTAVF